MNTTSAIQPKNIIRGLWENASMVVIFAVLFITLAFTVPYFATWQNMIGLALSVSTVGIIACTMLFCLASGDFDISVEAIVAFSGVLAAVAINSTGSVVTGIAVALLAASLAGAFNGVVIAKLRINALITTLATLQIMRGLGFIVSNGTAVGIKAPSFFVLGNGNLLGIPNPVWITIFSFLIFGFLLNRTTFGRNTLAIGGNKEAARLAGIQVDRIKILIFTLQGFMAGLAGVVLASRMTSGQPNTSVGLSLDVIAACVLGGVSLTGGVGTIVGTVVGVLIMGTVQNAMNLLNIPTFYQYVARGIILLLAVLFDQLRQRKSA